jgi:hypothetical protein
MTSEEAAAIIVKLRYYIAGHPIRPCRCSGSCDGDCESEQRRERREMVELADKLAHSIHTLEPST